MPKNNHSGLFKPGQSGNPSGRRALPEWFRDMGPDALKYMKKVAEGKIKDKKVSRYEACREIADRVFGKAPQAIDLAGSLSADNPAMLESQKRVEQRLAEILKRNAR